MCHYISNVESHWSRAVFFKVQSADQSQTFKVHHLKKKHWSMVLIAVELPVLISSFAVEEIQMGSKKSKQQIQFNDYTTRYTIIPQNTILIVKIH